MAAPKATTTQQSAAIDRRINEMELRGLGSTEIAAELGITPRAVQIRIKKLNERARLDRDAQIERELRTLDWVQQEAMDAWDRSKEDAESITVEQRGSGEGRGSKAVKRTEGQTGDAAYLAQVVRASESRRKLIGADAPVKSETIGTLTLKGYAIKEASPDAWDSATTDPDDTGH